MSLNTFSPEPVAQQREIGPANFRPEPGSKVVVAGAGAFGGWVALYLQRLGYRVTLCDPWGPGNSRSSSGGETRLIRSIYGASRLYTRMAAHSYSLWQDFEQLIGRQVMFPTGCWWFSREEIPPIIRDSIPHLDDLGLPYERLDVEQFQKEHEWINTEGLRSVWWEKRTGYLLAREATRLVNNQFVKEGGTFVLSGVRASHIDSGKIVSVTLDNGDALEASAYVMACGPWLLNMFPELLQGRYRITRQEVFYFGPPASHGGILDQQVPTWIDQDSDQHFYGIFGGIGRGLKIAIDLRGEPIDPTQDDRIPAPDKLAYARDYVAFRFPFMKDAPLLESRICQYSNTPDGNFIVDTHPEVDNLWLVGGGTGHGFKHGPVLGDLVSQMIAGKTNRDFEMSFDRFEEAPTYDAS